MVKRGVAPLVLLALLGLYVPSWPLQLVSFLGLAVELLSLLYSRAIRRGIRVERDAVEQSCHARATVEVGLTVRSASILPVAFLAVRDRTGGLGALGPTRAVLSLAPRGAARLEYAARSGERGVFELGPVTVSSADPLGLYPWELTLNERCRVTVFPPLGRTFLPAGPGLPGGDLRVRDPLSEDPTRMRGVREYVPGDDIRRISWKVSARLGTLHTVEYEASVSAPCLVLLDLRLERYPLRMRHHLVERAIEAAATLVVSASSARQAVGLCASALLDGRAPLAPPGRGIGHAVHILGLLARVAPVEGGADPVEGMHAAALRVPPGGRVCLVGPPPDDGAIRRARDGIGPGARLELYQVGGGREEAERSVPRGVRRYAVPDYGEEIAGD